MTIGLIFLVLTGCATCGRKASRNPNDSNQPPATNLVTIDPGDYKGPYYYLAGNTNVPFYCKQTVAIGSEPDPFLSVYGTGSRTDIYFKIDASGNIKPESIKPSGAASLKCGVLTFKTAKITVDPGNFDGGYILAGYDPTRFFKKHSFELVKSLRCWIEFYGHGMTNEIVFELNANGKINANSISNPLAISLVSPQTLKVNSTNVFITITNTNNTVFSGTFRVGNTTLNGPNASLEMVINYLAWIKILDSQNNKLKPLTNGMNPSSISLLDASNILQTFTFEYIKPRG